MLSAMGFLNSLININYECISAPTFTVLVEGIPHGSIHLNRGFEAKGPLSPYLFCIVMEFLSLRMEDSVSQGRLKPISKVLPIVSHLLYEDDVMFFLEAIVDKPQR